MLTFPKAPTVAPGDKITSAQFIQLCDAFNARLRSGLGDAAWRIAMWWYNYFRQIRRPDDLNHVIPSNGEFFFLTQLSNDPDFVFPPFSPGAPLGANLASPSNQLSFGSTQIVGDEERIDNSEWDRLAAVPLFINGAAPVTAEDRWELGKLQRGTVASDGSANQPAIDSARYFLRFTQPFYSQHGKSYGGYFPAPIKLLEHCDDSPDFDYYDVPSFEIKFTNLSDESTVVYPGTCPSGSDHGGAGQVIGIGRTPFAISVAVDDGAGGYALDTYKRSEWKEGPYEGVGELAHQPGQQMHHAIWAFTSEFRGSLAQRISDEFKIKKIGFDNQAFYTRQYALAPNYGLLSGDSIEAQYPKATTTGNVEAGTFLSFNSGESFTYEPGYVLAGIFAKATNLAAAVTLDVLNEDDKTIATIKLSKGAAVSEISWLAQAQSPESIRVRARTAIRFSGSGSLTFEANQLLDMKPDYWDGYLVQRMAATGGTEAVGIDSSGINSDRAKAIWESFARNGCIVSEFEYVADNGGNAMASAVFDAARRLSREHMRIVNEKQFVSYEVADEKAVLRFKRFIQSEHGEMLDCFQGIAPSTEPVEKLVEGETYIVRGSGYVTYRGARKNPEQTFTATSVLTFQAHDGAELFIHNGIRTEAFKRGFSNEWLMFIETKCYHWSSSSQWGETYRNFYTWNNRCHFASGSVGTATMRRHISYNYRTFVDYDVESSTYLSAVTAENVIPTFVAPEAPSGYNYAEFSNSTQYEADPSLFHKSCQIYRAPYELESATVEFDDNDNEIVVLTFTDRFQTHEDAPTSFGTDTSAWDSGLLTAETYRTDDNALREFALSKATATNYNCSWKIGDAGTQSLIQFDPDNPYGSCIPNFFFVKLIPKPYEDGNTRKNKHDSRCLIDQFQQMEIYLTAMCEGFVDGRTSVEVACRTGESGLFDYTMENLCFDAFGKTFIGDFNSGFGPLPNTKMQADLFNQFSACINLLDKARVDFPFEIFSDIDSYIDEYSLPSTGHGIGGVNCSNGADQWTVKLNYTPPQATTFNGASSLSGNSAIQANTAAFFDQNAFPDEFCNGAEFLFQTSRMVTNWGLRLLDTGQVEAIPELLRPLLESEGTGLIGVKSETRTTTQAIEVATTGEAEECDGTPFFHDAGDKSYRFEDIETVEESCGLFNGGEIDSIAAPTSDFYIGHIGSGSGLVVCLGGSTRSIGITPIADAITAFFKVQVVEVAP